MTETTPSENHPAAAPFGVMHALAELAAAWTATGLDVGKYALEATGRTLTRTAGLLHALRTAVLRDDRTAQ